MGKFDYKKWIIENKYGKPPKLTTQPEEEEWSGLSVGQDDVNEFQEKDPDAKAAAPKGGEEGGEKEKQPLDAAAITNQTSFGELSGEEDAMKILKQLQSRDPNQPIYQAMVYTDKKGTHKPDIEKIAKWIELKGADTIAQRMVLIGNKIKGDLGLPKKDMPFLPGPPDAKGTVPDVEDALNPGGNYNVDVKEEDEKKDKGWYKPVTGYGNRVNRDKPRKTIYDDPEKMEEKIDAPKPNTFVGMKDKAAKDYMDSGNQDGDPNDDQVTVEPGDSKAASELSPTQTNILVAKSISMAAIPIVGGNLDAWIGTNGEILDGHHRWAATMLNDPSAPIGYAGAVDMSALGMKPTLKHLTAIGNALGNHTKLSEAKDPRHSLYEGLEKHINKNI